MGLNGSLASPLPIYRVAMAHKMPLNISLGVQHKSIWIWGLTPWWSLLVKIVHCVKERIEDTRILSWITLWLAPLLVRANSGPVRPSQSKKRGESRRGNQWRFACRLSLCSFIPQAGFWYHDGLEGWLRFRRFSYAKALGQAMAPCLLPEVYLKLVL